MRVGESESGGEWEGGEWRSVGGERENDCVRGESEGGCGGE